MDALSRVHKGICNIYAIVIVSQYGVVVILLVSNQEVEGSIPAGALFFIEYDVSFVTDLPQNWPYSPSCF